MWIGVVQCVVFFVGGFVDLFGFYSVQSCLVVMFFGVVRCYVDDDLWVGFDDEFGVNFGKVV